MMSFGWRPDQSCYVSAAKQKASEASCKSATWFYLLLAAAVVAGAASKK